MNYIRRGTWDVKIVKGQMGNQNAAGYGPTAPAWAKYRTTDCISRNDVVQDAKYRFTKVMVEKVNTAEPKLNKEGKLDLPKFK
jgi:hypothetical protein